MLDILLGAINSSSDSFISKDIDITHLPQKLSFNSFPCGFIAQYSKYKPSIYFDNELFLISLTGFLQWKNKSINDATKLKELLSHYTHTTGTDFLKDLTGNFCLVIIDKKNASCLIQ